MKTEGWTVKVTNGVAGLGITLPAWWPTLAELSAFAAAVVPILSAIWLIIQIGRVVRETFRPKPASAPVPAQDTVPKP